MISERRLLEIGVGPALPALRPATVAMALAALVSGGIHAYVVGPHLREWWAAGAFFALAASVQIACSYVLLRTARRRGAIPAAITSAVLASVWLVSRTIGIPFGPGSGAREAIGAVDLLATATEIAVVVMFAVGRRQPRWPQRSYGVGSRFAAVGVVAVGLALGLVAAAVLPSHGHVRPPSLDHSHLRSDGQAHGVDGGG